MAGFGHPNFIFSVANPNFYIAGIILKIICMFSNTGIHCSVNLHDQMINLHAFYQLGPE